VAETSDEIRNEIEHTRERMSDTVDALAYKANVPRRAKNWLGEKKEAVTSAVSGNTPDGEEMKRGAWTVRRSAERNPLGLALGGAAVGFVVGLLMPSTRLEDERLGPTAGELKSTAADAGREALDRGKDVAQEAGQSALETAKERSREESEQLSASLQQKVEDAASTASEPGQPSGTSGRVA
jgi:Protein of unknown function (DUF3618)